MTPRPVAVLLVFALAACGNTVISETAGTTGPPSRCPSGPFGGAMIEVPAPQGGSYCIDATEVTNAQYAAFLLTDPSLASRPARCSDELFTMHPATGTFEPQVWPPPAGHDEHPVVGITWCAAATFCTANHKRLCGQIGGGDLAATALSEPGGFQDPALSEWFNACSAGGTKPYAYGTKYESGRCTLIQQPDPFTAVPTTAVPTASCAGGFPGLFDMAESLAQFIDACSPPNSIDAAQCLAYGGQQADANNPSCASYRGGVGFDQSPGDIGARCCADVSAHQ